jgi:hypothetical protein
MLSGSYTEIVADPVNEPDVTVTEIDPADKAVLS